MKLTNLVFAFFMRTKFMDLAKIGDFIEKHITPFLSEKGQKRIEVPPALPIDGIPRFQIHSTNDEYLINIYETRLDLVRMGVYDVSIYNSIIKEFITIAKQLLPIIESDENICGRLGMVNDTFFITETPIDTIIVRYFKQDAFHQPKQLNLSFTKSINIDGFDSNIITIIQPGELAKDNGYQGVLVRKDINIEKVHKQIDAKQVESFLDSSSILIDKENMEKILYDK